MRFHFEHEFDIDPQGFWKLFFDEAYNRELFPAIQIKERQILEERDDGETLTRAMRLIPAKELPAAFRSIIPDLSYIERDTYRRSRSAMDVVIESPVLKSKLDMKGTFSVTPVGANRCRRTFEGDLKISIFLVGGQLERFMLEEMKGSYDVAATVTRKWIERTRGTSG